MSHPTFKNSYSEIQLFTRRTLIVAVIIGVLSLALVVRLIYLQIYQHKIYTTLSQKNLLNLDPLEPNRGLIYDRHGTLLADNIPVLSLEIVPNRVLRLNNTLNDLARLIPLSKDELSNFRKELKHRRRFEAIPLKARLTEEETARFAVMQYQYPGVQIRARLARRYPFGSAFSAVLGYVGRINEQELNTVDPTNYSVTNYIGKLGIEKYFEHELHGRVGYQQTESDATGRIIRIVKRTDPQPGKNIYLTIDSRLQLIAQQAFGEQHGAAIAIDPQNGQVLAMVSTPSYDPRLFLDGITTKDFQALKNDSAQPLNNRAVRGQYPFGSTIKPFLALHGLETGAVTPSFAIFDPGFYQLKNSKHIYHDWQHSGHGWVNISTAIRISCDVYFFNLALKLGIKNIDEILSRFGFGKRTHIEIAEELPGLLPSPAWKKHAKGEAWFPGDTLNASIGQGSFLTTPLQLASATATLANHGQGFKPTLLWGMQSPGGLLTKPSATPLPLLQFQDKNWQIIVDAMKAVIQNGTGAIHFGSNAPYTAAGKTGTAQVFSYKGERYNRDMLPIKLRDNTLFIAFAPVDHPRIAVAVVAEHTDIAGNIARKMMDYYLKEN